MGSERGDTFNYQFTDHLGSTSITADSDGNCYGEMRYSAWGMVRYNAGETPTDYAFPLHTYRKQNVSSLGSI